MKTTTGKRIAALSAALLLIFAASLTACTQTGTDPKVTTSTTSPSVTDGPIGTTAGGGGSVTTGNQPVKEPAYINPMTGEETTGELSSQRPIAVVYNNSAPSINETYAQMAIGSADVLVEVPYEGGETRLIGIFQDYKNLGEIGSVRSARDYTVRFAADFSSIFVHAGADTDSGRELAMNAIRYGFTVSELIKSGLVGCAADCEAAWTDGVNNIDGVNDYFLAQPFYRDNARRIALGLEHSLMTSGAILAADIAQKGYSTTLSADTVFPYEIADFEEFIAPNDGDATHIYLPYSYAQTPQFIYNRAMGKYYRYQFDGSSAHIDGTTGEQLAFDNIIILYVDCSVFNGDTKGRLNVTYTGSGNGYYVFGGKYESITWSRSNPDDTLEIFAKSGEKLTINRGNVYMGIARSDMYGSTVLNVGE